MGTVKRIEIRDNDWSNKTSCIKLLKAEAFRNLFHRHCC